MSRRIAILGAGGQIGRTLLARLARDPDLRPFGVTRNALTAAPLRAAGLDVRLGNVLDARERDDVLRGADVVVNCASASSLWAQARIEDRATVEAALDAAPRLIHFSSVAVYSSCIDPERNTFDRPRPDAPYGRDKLNLERYAARSARERGRRLVVLRMGHVYGAEQWVSRYVLDRVGGAFRLPFDGQYPSNAVHVANVASAVRTLVHDERAEGSYNLFDPGQSTWRQVFDWNCEACGVAKVPSLDRVTSERLRQAFTGKAHQARPVAIAGEFAAWAKTLPMSLAASSPALRDLLMSTLSTLRRPSLDQLVLDTYGTFSVKRMAEPLPIKETWLLSLGAPGRNVSYPSEVGAPEREAVARWRRALVEPDGLFPAEVGESAAQQQTVATA